MNVTMLLNGIYKSHLYFLALSIPLGVCILDPLEPQKVIQVPMQIFWIRTVILLSYYYIHFLTLSIKGRGSGNFRLRNTLKY